MKSFYEFILTEGYELGNEVHGALYVNGRLATSSKFWGTCSIIEAEKRAMEEYFTCD